MAKFRCPRCGAVVEGLHERCPRCKVLFKYRKEDVDLLTPYQSPVIQTPERLDPPVKEEAPVEEAKPEVEEKLIVVEAPKEEEAVEAEVEEVKSEEVPVKEAKPELSPEQKKKAGTAALVFGLVGFFLMWVFSGILSIIFGGVACSKAKKSKPLGGGKATCGKVFGVLDIVFGIMTLLFVCFVIFLVFVGVLVVLFVPGVWEEIVKLFGGSASALGL